MAEKTQSKTKKIIKNVLKGFGIFLLVIVLAAVAIPYFFKDRIVEEVKKTINENVRAEINFGDFGVSMLRSFPDITLCLEDLTVDGVEEFKGVRLAEIKAFETRLDIMSVINGELMEIERISLDEPTLYVKVLKNGKANYDITIPTEELDTMEVEPTKFALNLSEYSITNGNVIYDDAVSDVWVEIVNLNHSGSGNFTEAIYDLATETTADKFTASSGGISYLNEVKTDIDMTINIDMNNSKYTFKENEVNLNALQLNFDGYVAMPNDDIEMDLKFGSPQTDFKAILSMIPAAYTSDFSSVKASGKMGLNGTVKGIYNDNKMPALDIDLSVANGSFQYPDLPLGMTNINVNANVKSPNENFDNMVVNVPKFHIELDKNPFDAKFSLKTPMSDPNVDATIKGKIDLAKLAKAFPMEGVKTLSGIINADIAAKMKMSDVTAEKYEAVDMRGKMTITSMNYVADGMPAVVINDLTTEFTPQNIQLTNFDAKLGKSDLQVKGYVENPLTYFSGEKTMTGDLNVRSKLFDVNEWMEDSEPSKVQNPDTDATSAETTEEGVFDKFAFNVDAEFGKLVYDVYNMKNMKAKGSFTPELFDIANFQMDLGKTDLQANGKIQNAFGYVFDGETVKGNLNLKSNKLDLNEIMNMGTETANSNSNSKTETTPAAEPEGDVFGRFDFMVEADAKEVNYDVYDLKNLVAKGHFGHNQFDISNFSTQIGKSDISGSARIFNALNYAFKSNQTVSGDLILNSKVMDLNDLMAMGTTETSNTNSNTNTNSTATEATEPALVPSDMNFNIEANMGKVIYDQVTLNSMVGKLILKDSKVSMNNVKANTLGGSMVLNGAYDTKDEKNPKFEFAYDISQFKFDESVKQLRSFKYILPIAEYIQGRFNSSLKINGVLGKDMMPKWETLNASGLLETVQAAIKGNPTLDKITKQLAVNDLNPFNIKDSKNYFEIKNGKFTIKPFNLEYKDVLFTIGGSHGIAQTLDYTIKAKVPRAMLNKNKATAAVNTGLDLLSGQASKLGIDLAQGDYINVDILLTGAIKKPEYKLKLVGTEGKASALEDAAKQKLEEEAEKLKKEAEERLQKEKEALENKAKSEADKLKKEAEAKAKAEADRLKKEAEAKMKAEADRLKKEAEERIKKELGDKASEAAKAEAERLRKEAEARIDAETKAKLEAEKKRIQDELDKLNPFKKKKGGGE